MKGLRRTLAAIMALAVAAYLILMPQYLADALQKDPYREWLEPEQEPYTGVLTVWHIVGFKPHTGSLGNWLCKWTERMEKRHNGVFFEVLSLTPEEAEGRIARGEKADIYSFPSGWAYAEQLQQLSVIGPEIREGLRDTGRDGGLLSLPYALSGYCLLINSELALERELSLPEGNVTAQWLTQAAAAMQFERKGKTISALAGDTIAAARLGMTVPVAAYEDFLSGRTAMALADLRKAGDLKRQMEAGKGFLFSAHPIDAYTDQVQFIALARGMQEEKRLYAEELIDLILGEEAQLSLGEIGMFPAVAIEETPEYSDALLTACAFLYCEPISPNTFTYRRLKDALYEAATLTLTGDASAGKEFDARMKELVPSLKIQ